MTQPPPPSSPPPRWTSRQVRDAVALLLVFVGVVWLASIAWSIGPRAGGAATAVALCGLGLLLGLER